MSLSQSQSSRPGVSLARAALALDLFAAAVLIAVAVGTWRSDLPTSLPLAAAGGAVAALGSAWNFFHTARLRAGGSLPRAEGGVLVLRLHDSLRPGCIAAVIGGSLFTVAGSALIAEVVTDTAELSAGTRMLGAAVLVFIGIAFAAWTFVAMCFLRARFEADAVGIRWSSPLSLSSGDLGWNEIVGYRLQKRLLAGWGLVVETGDGRSRRVEFIEPAMGLSQEANVLLTAELEALHRRASAS